ncbi:hypothetical protein SH1V18_33750 [Vallitalea longa]|uniref:Uncharacterized protein n=1 Tax=Vallitalea longa TaxID=2936439 RepID=A0A9W5YBE5_9FIRM|nr:ATP-binding cassette domain-containing protein [Vallitalea longa]GKX30895.1 hypothetical protein SH1V18_33750 [Vallitalea longa]
MDDNIILQIKNLSGHSLDGFQIHDINLNLSVSEIHFIVGENNSGQKAFINTLAGVTPKIKGEIVYKGQVLRNSFKVGSDSEVSFLSQENTLVDDLTIAENLALMKFPKTKGFGLIKWKQVEKQAKKILERINIDINVDMKVSSLTDENRKLVEIAKVFIGNPKIVVLFEPTEKLSTRTVIKLYDFLREYKKNGVSMIYVTKNWQEALKIADNISVLYKGRIKGRFTGKEVKNNPQELLNILNNNHYKKNELDRDYESKEILDSIFKAAEFLTSEYELKDVLLFLAESVTKAMNADGCRIDLLDVNTDSIIDTFKIFKINDLHAKLKKEFVIRLIKKDTLYYSNQQDKEFDSLFEYKENIRTIICIPLLVRSRVSGVIQILYKDLYVHSTDEAKYLLAFAKQAAIAIEDTRLMGRSALLQESHHRIKNNLQAISSFIILQKRYLDEEQKEFLTPVLENIVSRIKSIAAVHDLLSKDQIGRSIINIKDLVGAIIKFINVDTRVEIKLDIEDMFIPYSKATSIALIINELVSNCNKHAFPDFEKRYNAINIKGIRKDNQVLIIIHDNGLGFKKGFDIEKVNSLGLTIVSSIIKNEFGGEVEFSNDQGAKIELSLSSCKVFVGM